MRITTTDPMTGNDVTDLANAPFLIEGEGAQGLKIYFESEVSKQEYLEFTATAVSEKPPIEAYNRAADNETTGTIN